MCMFKSENDLKPSNSIEWQPPQKLTQMRKIRLTYDQLSPIYNVLCFFTMRQQSVPSD